MKKIKIKVNFFILQDLVASIENKIVELLVIALSEQRKIDIDIYIHLRNKLKQKLLKKETAFNKKDKFKLEMNYFEAAYLLKVFCYGKYPNEYTKLDQQLRSNEYFIENV